MSRKQHIPVLLQEVIKILKIKRGKKYIDATVGMGGHAIEIVKRGGLILGIDRDSQSLERLKFKIQNSKFKIEDENLTLIHGDFRNIKQIAEENNFTNVSGILFDLGLSSWQIDKSGRGFSYLKNEPLDMRFNSIAGLTAKDFLNSAARDKLYEVFTKYGEEQHSRRIAESVFRAGILNTTFDFKKAITKAVGNNARSIKIISRIFQAVRIEINKELESLDKALEQAIDILESNGKLLVISFHSLEDRTVKLFFRNVEYLGKGKILTKKPIKPSKNEIKKNIRARSAKLRVFQKK